MTMPTDIGAIDLMLSFPKANASKTYDYLRQTTRGDDSSTAEFPAGYMFKDVPNKLDDEQDGVAVTLREMAKWGVDMGMCGIGSEATEPRVRATTRTGSSPAPRSIPTTSPAPCARSAPPRSSTTSKR